MRDEVCGFPPLRDGTAEGWAPGFNIAIGSNLTIVYLIYI